MNEVTKSELAEAMPDFGVSFVQVSSDATRHLCEQGQSVARTMGEWNTQVSHFLANRVARNGEAIGRMTKCQNLPDAFAIQAQWAQDAADDYLSEMGKLMEVNSRIMRGLLGSVGQVEMPASTETPTHGEPSPAAETPSLPEVRSAPETSPSPDVGSASETPALSEARSPETRPATRLSPARATAKAED